MGTLQEEKHLIMCSYFSEFLTQIVQRIRGMGSVGDGAITGSKQNVLKLIHFSGAPFWIPFDQGVAVFYLSNPVILI